MMDDVMLAEFFYLQNHCQNGVLLHVFKSSLAKYCQEAWPKTSPSFWPNHSPSFVSASEIAQNKPAAAPNRSHHPSLSFTRRAHTSSSRLRRVARSLSVSSSARRFAALSAKSSACEMLYSLRSRAICAIYSSASDLSVCAVAEESLFTYLECANVIRRFSS